MAANPFANPFQNRTNQADYGGRVIDSKTAANLTEQDWKNFTDLPTLQLTPEEAKEAKKAWLLFCLKQGGVQQAEERICKELQQKCPEWAGVIYGQEAMGGRAGNKEESESDRAMNAINRATRDDDNGALLGGRMHGAGGMEGMMERSGFTRDGGIVGMKTVGNGHAGGMDMIGGMQSNGLFEMLKNLAGGQGEGALSPEEQQQVMAAMQEAADKKERERVAAGGIPLGQGGNSAQPTPKTKANTQAKKRPKAKSKPPAAERASQGAAEPRSVVGTAPTEAPMQAKPETWDLDRWTCTDCGEPNKASRTSCNNCAAPRQLQAEATDDREAEAFIPGRPKSPFLPQRNRVSDAATPMRAAIPRREGIVSL